jgi:tetratricopeptide (TPR) repeat protein
MAMQERGAKASIYSMKIRLSTIPEYKQFKSSLFDGKYDEAEKSLNACFEIAKNAGDYDAVAFFNESYAELCVMTGQVERALEHYLEAEKISQNSSLTKYNFAKFLADKLQRHEQAISKCEEVVKTATLAPWNETEDDFGSSYYLAQCYALEGYCYCVLDNYNRAGEMLLKLLALQNETAIEFGVRLCDSLLKNGRLIIESKEYLNRLLKNVVAIHGEEQYQDFIQQIRGLLAK